MAEQAGLCRRHLIPPLVTYLRKCLEKTNSNQNSPALVPGPHQELEEGGVGGLLKDVRLDVREEGLAGAVTLVVRLLPALQVDRVLVLRAQSKVDSQTVDLIRGTARARPALHCGCVP